MLVQADLVLLEVEVLACYRQRVQHRHVQQVAVEVVGIGDAGAHLLPGVEHDREGGVDNDSIHDGFSVLRVVFLDDVLRGRQALVLVRQSRIEQREGVHTSAFDLIHQGIYGCKILVYPERAGEKDAYVQLFGIQSLEVILAGDVPVHSLVIESVAPVLDGFRGLELCEAEIVCYAAEQTVIVLRTPAGRIPAQFAVLVVGSLEHIAVHHGDVGVPAEDQHHRLAFAQNLHVPVRALETVYVAHAPDEYEIGLLGEPYQFLVHQHVVVRIVRVDGESGHVDTQFLQPLGRLRHDLRIGGLYGDYDRFELHIWTYHPYS